LVGSAVVTKQKVSSIIKRNQNTNWFIRFIFVKRPLEPFITTEYGSVNKLVPTQNNVDTDFCGL